MRALALAFAAVWLLVLGLWIAGRWGIAAAPDRGPAHGTVSAPPVPYLVQVAGDAQRALEKHLEPLGTPPPRVHGRIEPLGASRAVLVVEASDGDRRGRAEAEGDPSRLPGEVARLADEAIARVSAER